MADLLEDVKDSLRITWSEEDAYLNRMIERAKTYLDQLIGTSFDYDQEGQHKTLLLERCRYVYNNAAYEFETNYAHEISRLMLDVAIQKAGEQNGETATYRNI